MCYFKIVKNHLLTPQLTVFAEVCRVNLNSTVLTWQTKVAIEHVPFEDLFPLIKSFPLTVYYSWPKSIELTPSIPHLVNDTHVQGDSSQTLILDTYCYIMSWILQKFLRTPNRKGWEIHSLQTTARGQWLVVEFACCWWIAVPLFLVPRNPQLERDYHMRICLIQALIMAWELQFHPKTFNSWWLTRCLDHLNAKVKSWESESYPPSKLLFSELRV